MPTHQEPISPEIILNAYCNGYFPMWLPDEDDIGWFSPDPRGIIPIQHFRINRSTHKAIKRNNFEIVSDHAFRSVIEACALPRPGREETWISPMLIDWYCSLHELGFAHSIEAYQNGILVGGVYGISINSVFFGESMFSDIHQGGTNASKVCLVTLLQHLKNQGYTLFDTQWRTPHLDQFGCVEINRAEYIIKLHNAIRNERHWIPLESHTTLEISY